MWCNTYRFKMICNCSICMLGTIKSKIITVIGSESPVCSETSRLPHILDNWFTEGDEVLSLTHRPNFTPSKFLGPNFRYSPSRHQGHKTAGKIKSIEKFNNPIGNQTRDLPACSIVPQPSTLPHAPVTDNNGCKIVNSRLEK
jgi:hypothetical protein